MNFGGFIGGGSNGGGGGGDARMMADNLLNTISSSALAHSQPHMVVPLPPPPPPSPHIVEPIFKSSPLSLAVVCSSFSPINLYICGYACLHVLMDSD